jgi:holo-[acyl-carrier protein] synthase
MVGIDLVEISRITLADSFVTLILTQQEQQEYAQLRTEHAQKEYLAGRFAAKEAIFKATQDQDYLKYSILHSDSGKPFVLNHPEMDLSISHDGGMAAAIVMIR